MFTSDAYSHLTALRRPDNTRPTPAYTRGNVNDPLRTARDVSNHSGGAPEECKRCARQLRGGEEEKVANE